MEVWTIELNLDDDYSKSTSYHVDEVKNTIHRNVEMAFTGKKAQNWALVGLANSHVEASDKCERLQKMLCKSGGKTFKTLGFEYK